MTPEDEEFNRIEREAAMRTEAVRATVTPRKWVGLTDEDWKQLYDDFAMGQELDEFAEAIEAKLREKNT